MAFSNQTIKPPRAHKPHIVFIDGWWRVSSLCPKARIKYAQRWNKAHDFIGGLHARRS